MTEKTKGSTASVSLERRAVEALDEACGQFEAEHNMSVSRNQMMRKIILDWLERQSFSAPQSPPRSGA